MTATNANLVTKSSSPLPLPRLSYRALLLQKALPRVPVTAEGLPIGYYRVDLLPEESLSTPNSTNPNEELEALRNAYADLSFEYGYPTLPDGRPFWYKLDFEPSFAYAAFQIYLEAAQTGPRELAVIAGDEELRRVFGRMVRAHQSQPQTQAQSQSQTRSSDAEPATQDRDQLPTADDILPQLYEFSILYAWRARARAYDLYKEAAYRHLKLRRQTTVEDEHYVLSSNLLKELKDRVLNTEGFFQELATSPKAAIDLLAKLVAIQRVSVGLPASGPLPNKEAPEDLSFEMIMRTLGQKVSNHNIYDQQTGQVTSQSALSKVLSDQQSANMLQEVIIRVTKASQQPLDSNSGSNNGKRFLGRGRSHTITSDDLQDPTPYDIEGAPGANLDGSDESDESGAPNAPNTPNESGRASNG